MITLPEELLKCSEQELKQILTAKNIYTANYVTIGKILYKRIHTYKNQLICVDTSDQDVITFDTKDYEINLFTVDNFEKAKKENLSLFLNICSDNQFANYLRNLGKDIFGEDRIDVQINQDNEHMDKKFVELIVYFPEITISNSHELSHTMYDIYVKFQFGVRNNIRILLRTGIARTTFSIGELHQHYTFSHCSTDPGYYSSSCCFGSTVLSEITKNAYKGTLIGNIPSILLSFEEYLKWESLEGTPYSYISNISNIEKYKIHNYFNSDYSQFYNYIITQVPSFKYQFNLINGNYQINLDISNKEDIEKLLTEKFISKCYYVISNDSYTINRDFSSEYTNIETKYTQVVFKGDKKKFKIVKNEQEKVIPQKRIHRTILNGVITMLENNFYNQMVSKKLEEVI